MFISHRGCHSNVSNFVIKIFVILGIVEDGLVVPLRLVPPAIILVLV